MGWFDDEDDEKPAQQEAVRPSISSADPKLARDYLAKKYLQAGDDSEVRAAQDHARSNERLAGMMEGLDQILMAPAVSRGKATWQPGGYDFVRKAGQRGVEDARRNRSDRMELAQAESKSFEDRLKQEREGVMQGRQDTEWAQKQADKTRADAARGLEDNPDSEVSKTYQALAGKYTGKPEMFAGKSATQLKGLIPTLQDTYAVDQRRLDRSDAAADRLSARREAAQDRAAARKDAIDARRQDKADALAEKRAHENEQLVVPGFDRVPGVGIKPDEAAKARQASGEMNSLNKGLEEYKRLVKENGSFEWGGKGGAQMESLATSIRMSMKNLYELGALSGPDMAIIESQISDPSSMRNLFTRDSTLQANLDRTKKSLNDKFQASMTSKGYQQQLGAGSSASVVRMRDPQSGKVLNIPANKAQEAMGMGFEDIDGRFTAQK